MKVDRVFNWKMCLPVIFAIMLLVMPGCSSGTTTNTFTGNSSTTPTAVVSSTSTAVAPQILKIGYLLNMQSSSPLDSKRAVDAIVAMDNKNGGWNIGGQQYQIQVIAYDTGTSDQATETAAINRLIFQDGVKYVIDYGNLVDSDIPITEANNVVNISMAMNPPVDLAPNTKLTFGSTGMQVTNAGIWGWMVQNYSLANKKVVGTFPDSQFGHFIAMSTINSAKPFGINLQGEFFPPDTQDFSALATKIVSENPDFFIETSGSDALDANVYNALRLAGYKGQFFSQVTISQVLVEALSPDALEGFISSALATDFDPPLTQTGVDVKNAWVAKYGSWSAPNLSQLPGFFMLKAALKQAGSLDVDKVNAVLNNGMKFDTPSGPAQMFSRTDIGNSRTCDVSFTIYIKKFVQGKPVLIQTISTDDAIKNFRIANPPLPPGATLPAPGGPPGGGAPGGGPPGAPSSP